MANYTLRQSRGTFGAPFPVGRARFKLQEIRCQGQSGVASLSPLLDDVRPQLAPKKGTVAEGRGEAFTLSPTAPALSSPLAHPKCGVGGASTLSERYLTMPCAEKNKDPAPCSPTLMSSMGLPTYSRPCIQQPLTL
ncbi:hypothetical protein ElyMa_000544600 [Elysia marginata]|uniref:Uncharacterized protein n=1 Tax=Elysia marginata TaxID=1093978 RepID=A0AAV4G0Q5_9GAST|nr:hypothetical protein ElyMa_000544600 [Elysia marginata]